MQSDSKSLNKEIITLAWPAVLQTLVRSFVPIIDSFWIGKLGPEHLAAITVGSFLSWGLFALGGLLPIGTNSLVAQSCGAKQTETTKHIATLNLINALLFGILISLCIFPLLPVLYNLTNLDTYKSILANQYLFPLLLGYPALILFETGNSIYRGNGDTQTPFRLLVFAVIIKLSLTPLLIFGTGDFKGLEISGAPLATIISYGLAFIIGFIFLKRRQLINPIIKKFKTLIIDVKQNWKITKETIKIGIPLSMEGLAFVAIYIFVSRFVSDFGTVGLAALGIGHRSEAIPYQIGEGFSITASILVGHNIGAGKPDRAETAAWRVLFLSWIPMLIYGCVLIIFPAEVAGIFTKDTNVIETARVYNLIAGFSIFFAASESVFTGAFAGAGNSLPPLLISLPVTAMRIPLCAIFAPIYGMNGIWIAIFSTSILKGIIFAGWFKKGNWKNRKFKLAKENPYEFVDLR